MLFRGLICAQMIFKVAILILVSYFSACRRSREEAERDGDEEVHGLRGPIRQRHTGKTGLIFIVLDMQLL